MTAAAAREPRPAFYTHANLVDTRAGKVMPDVAISVTAGRIDSVIPMGRYSASASARVIDLKGRYVVPGLINTHVHLATSAVPKVAKAYLQRELLSGVTAVRDMAGDARLLGELKREAEFDEIPAPDIFYAALFAGPEFFVDPRTHEASRGRTPGAVPWMQAVTVDSNLQLAVARAAGTGATGIKLYADLSAPLVAALTSEAHRQHLLVWAHAATFPAKPSDVARAGVDAMSHACALGYEVADPPLASFEDARHVVGSAGTRPDPAIGAVLADMHERGTILDATLWPYHTDNVGSCTAEQSDSLTAAAVRAGVAVSVGTDDDWDPVFAQSQVLTEMEWLVTKAGMTPAAVLKSATIVGAQAIGEQDRMGTVEAGKAANFVVLFANPLANIDAIRHADFVVKHGRRHAVIPMVTRRARAPSAQ